MEVEKRLNEIKTKKFEYENKEIFIYIPIINIYGFSI